MRLTGERYANTANTDKIPSYTLYDIGARYATRVLDKSLIVRLNVFNLTGKDYWQNYYIPNPSSHRLLSSGGIFSPINEIMPGPAAVWKKKLISFFHQISNHGDNITADLKINGKCTGLINCEKPGFPAVDEIVMPTCAALNVPASLFLHPQKI